MAEGTAVAAAFCACFSIAYQKERVQATECRLSQISHGTTLLCIGAKPNGSVVAIPRDPHLMASSTCTVPVASYIGGKKGKIRRRQVPQKGSEVIKAVPDDHRLLRGLLG